MTPAEQPTLESILRRIVREEVRAALIDAGSMLDGRQEPTSGVEANSLALSTAQVSALTGVAEQTLCNWRSQSKAGEMSGPPSFKLGRLVRYDPDALGGWLAQRRSATKGPAAL